MLKLLEDDYFFTTKNEMAFFTEIKKIQENTRWVKMPITDLRFDEADTSKIYYNGVSNLTAENYSTELLSLEVYQNATKTLLDRARISGTALSDLSTEVFTKFVNECFVVGKGDAILNVLEETLCAAHSDNYIVLPIENIFKNANKFIHNEFKNAIFMGGGTSVDFSYAEYNLVNEKQICDTFKKALSGKLANFNSDISPIIRFTSSNTGFSGANIYPYFGRKCKGGSNIAFQISKPIMLEHKGEATLEKYNENLSMIFAMVQESAEKLAELKNTKINHPVSCFLNVAKRISLPKKLVMQAVIDFEEYLGDGDAFGVKTSDAQSVYFGLTEIINYATQDGKNEKYILLLQDLLSRALVIEWNEYDTVKSDWEFEAVTPMSMPLMQSA